MWSNGRKIVSDRLGNLEVNCSGQDIALTYSVGWVDYQPGEVPFALSLFTSCLRPDSLRPVSGEVRSPVSKVPSKFRSHSQIRRFAFMNKLSRFLLGWSLVLTCSCVAAAQEKSQANQSIPKVLQITREFTKPGRAGFVHDAAESAFVQAMNRAKWPTRYLAMTSLSGKQRALFLTSYASLEAWEKDTAGVAKNP